MSMRSIVLWSFSLFLFHLLLVSGDVPLCDANTERNITITQTSIVGYVIEVFWLTQEHVFVLTNASIAYHSPDSGKTWQNILPILGITDGGIVDMYAIGQTGVYLLSDIGSDGSVNVWVYDVKDNANFQKYTIQELYTIDPHPTNNMLAVACIFLVLSLSLYSVVNNYPNLYVIRDWGGAPVFLYNYIYGLLIINDVILITNYVDSELYSSSLSLPELKWIKANFPLNLPKTIYTILDISVGSIIMHLVHDSSYSGNLYMSDSFDSNFVLVLSDVVRDPTVPYVSVRLLSVSGVMIANQYTTPKSFTNSRTVISFDNGGEWNQLPAPTGACNTVCGKATVISADEIYQIQADCGLQLRFSRQSLPYGPLLSRRSAVGLIVGPGNVGTGLDTSNLEVYFSRTAGQNWTTFSSQLSVYEFSDHGGLMTMASLTPNTNTLRFSCGYFDCVRYGQNADGTSALFHLDFSTLHERQCNSSDYEDWSLGSCILGQHVSYTRRKQASECYNPLDYEPEKKTAICPCANIDYECDYCFEPDGEACRLVCNEVVNRSCDGNKHLISRGYRLVPGTVCNVSAGLDLLPLLVECKPAKSGPSTTMILAVSLGVVFVVLVVAAAVIWKSERTRRWFEDRISWGRYKLLGRKGDNEFFLNPADNIDDDGDDAPVLNDDAIVHFGEKSPAVK